MSFTRTVAVSSGSSTNSYSKSRTITGNNQVTLTATLGIPVTGCTANSGTDVITATAHGQSTGDVVTASAAYTGAGALPTGLSAFTAYYVINVDADTLKLATTLANAIAGTAVNITANGGAFALVPAKVFSPVSIPVLTADGDDALKWLAFKVSASHAVTYNFLASCSIDAAMGPVDCQSGSDFIFPGTNAALSGGVASLEEGWTSAGNVISSIFVYPYGSGNFLDALTSSADVTVDALTSNES